MTDILDRARLAAEQRRDRQRRINDLLRLVEDRIRREAAVRQGLEAAQARLLLERDEAQGALAAASAERDAALAEVRQLRGEVSRLEAALGEVLALLEEDGAAADETLNAFEALLHSDPVPDAGIGHNSLAAPGDEAPAAVAPEAAAPADVAEDGQVFSDASLVELDPVEAPPPARQDQGQSQDFGGDQEPAPAAASPVLDPDTERRLRVLEDFLEQGLVTSAEYDRRRLELTRTSQTF